MGGTGRWMLGGTGWVGSYGSMGVGRGLEVGGRSRGLEAVVHT